MAEYQLPKQLFLDETALRVLPEIINKVTTDKHQAAALAYDYAYALWNERKQVVRLEKENELEEKIERGEGGMAPTGRAGPEI